VHIVILRLGGLCAEIFEQVKELVSGKGQRLFPLHGGELEGQSAFLLGQIVQAGDELRVCAAGLNGIHDILAAPLHVMEFPLQGVPLQVGLLGIGFLHLHHGIGQSFHGGGVQEIVTDGAKHLVLEHGFWDIVFMALGI